MPRCPPARQTDAAAAPSGLALPLPHVPNARSPARASAARCAPPAAQCARPPPRPDSTRRFRGPGCPQAPRRSKPAGSAPAACCRAPYRWKWGDRYALSPTPLGAPGLVSVGRQGVRRQAEWQSHPGSCRPHRTSRRPWLLGRALLQTYPWRG